MVNDDAGKLMQFCVCRNRSKGVLVFLILPFLSSLMAFFAINRPICLLFTRSLLAGDESYLSSEAS